MHNSILNSSEMKFYGEDLIELGMKQANSRDHDKLIRQKKTRRRSIINENKIKQSVPKAKYSNYIQNS